MHRREVSSHNQRVVSSQFRGVLSHCGCRILVLNPHNNQVDPRTPRVANNPRNHMIILIPTMSPDPRRVAKISLGHDQNSRSAKPPKPAHHQRQPTQFPPPSHQHLNVANMENDKGELVDLFVSPSPRFPLDAPIPRRRVPLRWYRVC